MANKLVYSWIDKLWQMSPPRKYIATRYVAFKNKIMKKFVITFWTLLIFSNLFGQVNVTWESVKTINPTTISVKVFVQNLGPRLALWNKYGEVNYNGQEELNFSVEYDNIQTGIHIVQPPASITIKTIIGGSIPMPTPVYYFDPTGTDSGERWEIIFILPKESENVVINVLGEKKFFGDMPFAKEARKAMMKKFLSEKNTKIFDYQDFYPKDYKSIKNNLENTILTFIQNKKSIISSGTIEYKVEKNGKTSFICNFDNNQLENYLSEKIGNYKLQKTERFGYELKSHAIFHVFIAKGKTTVKVDKNGFTKINPKINNQVLINTIRSQINNKDKGLYKVKYDYISLNNEIMPNSIFEVKHIPVDIYLLWGIPIIISIIFGIKKIS